MTLRSVVFYLPDDMEILYRDVTKGINKSRWFRDAVLMFLDVGSRDTATVSSLPDHIDPKEWTKHLVNVPEEMFDEILDVLPRMGEPIYSIASKAVMYRLILESTGARTIPVRFTAEELDQIQAMHMTVQDAVHELLRRSREADPGRDA